jgi:ubiquinone/menaquinone biosynthesis C-methylase UbiE
LYWSQDQLHSCISGQSAHGQETLNAVWAKFVEKLPDGAKVLDLATGNGAVPVALLETGKALSIDAVDRADIDPTRYLSEHPELAAVSFHSNLDILELPFGDHAYEALTSQFGIEYGGLEPATAAVQRLLAPAGWIGFLIHHEDSEILRSSARKLSELTTLLDEHGLISVLNAVLQGRAAYDQLESTGRRYLDMESIKTEAISGQVFAGINQISQLMETDSPQAVRLGATLNLRLKAEQHRLQQLTAAARSEEQFSAYLEQLEALNFSNIRSRKIHADGALIGCFVEAQSN